MGPQDHSLGPPPIGPPPVPPLDAPIEAFRSPRPVARTLLVFMGIVLALDVIGVISDFAEYALLERAKAGELITIDEANTNDTRQAALGGLQLLGYIVTAIVFIVWFRRAYRNLPALGARNLRFKPGWAVGAWFVPILNLFRPVQITFDIWRASDPDMSETVNTPWVTRPTSALIGFWWAAWIISNFAGQYAFRVPIEANSLAELQQGSVAFIIADVTSAISTILAIALVWKMTARQDERARRMSLQG